MKIMKKLSGFLLAAIMVLTMCFAVSAAETGSITITTPSTLESGKTVTYNIYKVFDAVGNGTSTTAGDKISYKVMDSKKDAALPTGFVKDSAGNVYHGTIDADGNVTESTATALTADEIASIAAYVNGDTAVATVKASGPSAQAVASNLPNGYYYITTSTGTLVTIDSTNPSASVEDKNTTPVVDKTITGASSVDENGKKALAQIGTDVSFQADVTVAKGAEKYVFKDTMTSGLKAKQDVKVYIGETEVGSSKYTVTYGTASTDPTITVTFNDAYMAGLDVGTTLTVKYSATITESAVTSDPEHNTATISYGDNSGYTSEPSTVDVYNATITVVKKDGDGEYLAGAGFVLKKGEQYYKYTAATDTATETVTWVDSIDDATVCTSDNAGKLDKDFIGLANGTYTLIEKNVPEGYNKAADQTITIAEHDYTATNLEQSKDVTNKKGSVLPSTGGIGTTIFYVIGAILVIGAGVVLVARKRAQNM